MGRSRRGFGRASVLVSVVAILASILAAAAPVGAQNRPTCDGKRATIVGTEGNDTIVGTDGDDVIVGLGGRDRIFGGAGNDIICGGPGGDLLRGQRGRDRLFGDQGNDRLQGNNGRDLLDGGGGRDAIRGDRGPDTIIGGGGADRINAGPDLDNCDLDRQDFFNACERGDVLGASGFGNGGFNINLDASFIAHQADVGPRPYYVVEVISVADRDGASHRVEFLDKQGNLLDVASEIQAEWSAEFIISETPARVEVAAEGPWEVVIKKPQLIERLGREVAGNGSQVFLLKRPIGANETGTLILADNVVGNVVLWTYTPGRFPDLRVNEVFPQVDGTNLYEGAEREGAYLIEVGVDLGDWEMRFTG